MLHSKSQQRSPTSLSAFKRLSKLFDMLLAERFDQGMKFSRPFLKPGKRLFADLELF